jgi:ankyrin repeat protein
MKIILLLSLFLFLGCEKVASTSKNEFTKPEKIADFPSRISNRDIKTTSAPNGNLGIGGILLGIKIALFGKEITNYAYYCITSDNVEYNRKSLIVESCNFTISPFVYEKFSALKLRLRNGENINKENSIGDTALITIARNADSSDKNPFNHLDFVLKNGADVNHQNKNGQTALMFAVNHNVSMIEALLKHGANPYIKSNIESFDGKRILHKNSFEYMKGVHSSFVLSSILSIFYKYGYMKKTEPLSVAIMQNNENQINIYIDKKEYLNKLDMAGYPALMYAVRSNNITITKELIDKGTDLNVTIEDYDLLSYLVESTNDVDMVKYLLNYYNINKSILGGETLLYKFSKHKNLEMIDMLLSNGARDISTKYDDCALRRTAKWLKDGNKSLIKRYINAKPSKQCKFNSLLEIAGSEGDNLELFKEILKYENSTKQSKTGATALSVASSEGNVKIIKYILNNGFDVNLQTGYFKETALMKAVRYNKVEAVKLLVDFGADLSIRNNLNEGLDYYSTTDEMDELLENISSKK